MLFRSAAVCSIWGLLAASIAVNGQTQAGSPVLADDFYAGLRASPAIRRDFFLDGHLNKILSGRGRVVSVDATGRYKRRYRIVLEGPFVSPKITFYLFADGDDYRSLLSEGDLFEFKGQFVVYTPLDSRREAYIFDVVMEEGAVVVDEGG